MAIATDTDLLDLVTGKTQVSIGFCLEARH